jgi:hypothetical protein
MKEITRRLYTKPVMLGLAFLVGVGLLVGMFVTSKSRAAVQTIFIQHGNDEFETTGNGESHHDFAGSKIPAEFFGPGSNEFAQDVPMVGVPLNPGVNNIDTVIQRTEDVYIPGHPTTPLQMTGLSLRSINPISVTYSNHGPEDWTVEVNLSDYKASTGSMTINGGGTFDSTLKVWPKFTFRRVSDNKTLIYDTGAGNALTAASASEDAVVVEPGPEPAPTVAPAPCPVVVSDFEGRTISNGDMSAAAASSSCPPVNLTSTNSPWKFCNGRFCIPFPITEADRWAAHNASPPGTKPKIVVKQAAVAE